MVISVSAAFVSIDKGATVLKVSTELDVSPAHPIVPVMDTSEKTVESPLGVFRYGLLTGMVTPYAVPVVP